MGGRCKLCGKPRRTYEFRSTSRPKKTLGADAVLHAPEDLLLYEYDGSVEIAKPECVVFPGTTEDVVAIVQIANRYKTPVVGRGAGTGLSGGALARQGGIITVFSRMNRILEIDVENQRATSSARRGEFRFERRGRAHRTSFRARSLEPEGLHDRRKRFRKFRRAAHAGLRRHDKSCARRWRWCCPLAKLMRLGGSALDATGYDLTGLVRRLGGHARSGHRNYREAHAPAGND